MSGKLKTHLNILDWEILKWNEFPEHFWIRSPEFTFFHDEKFYIEVIKNDLELTAIIPRPTQTPFPSHGKMCLIDRHGQERLTETQCGTFDRCFLLVKWDLQEVNCAIRNEDQLIIRCIVSVESFASEKCTSRVEESLLEESNSSNFLETLSTDFETLYKEETESDCVLKTIDRQFRVHRTVLSARSKVFAAMFHHDTSERRTGEVDIQDVEAIILGEVLHFAYTGKVRDLTRDNAVRLYAAADKYALHQLRDACLIFLMNNLEIENVCDAAVLAHTHAEKALEDKVVQFIAEKLEEIVENEVWKGLLSKNLVLGSNLLTAAFLTYKSSSARK